MAKNKKTRKPIGLAYSDHHLNIWNNFNQGNRRLTDGLSVMKILKLKAKVLNVPILFTGDLLHKEKQVSNKLLSILLPFFKKIWGSSKYPTFAIDGNHDQCEENTLDHESPSYIKTFSQIYKGLNCVNNESVEYNNLMIHGVPYLTHDLGLNQAIDNRIKKINKKKINILGSGVAALSCASFLAKAGHDVSIFEKNDTDSPPTKPLDPVIKTVFIFFCCWLQPL